MKTWISRGLKTFGILLVALIVLLGGLLLLLQLQGPRTFAVEQILSSVNESLPGHASIEVGSIRGSLLGSARLEDLRILDGRGHFAGDVESVDVSFRLLPLIRGVATVRDITVEGAVLVVRTYEDGELNWLTLTEPTEDDDPAELFIHLESVAVIKATILYLDESIELEDQEIGEDLLALRSHLSTALDEQTSGVALREIFLTEAKALEEAGLQGPRAPFFALIDDVETTATVRLQGDRIEAQVPALVGTLYADLLATSHNLRLQEVALNASEEATEVSLGEVRVSDLLLGRDINVALTEPDEAIVVDLGVWDLFEPLLRWALGEEVAEDIVLQSPLTLEGRVGLNDEDLHLNAQISSSESEDPLRAHLFLRNFTADSPDFELTLFLPRFRPHHWLATPELPPFEGNLTLQLAGTGFDPDEMTASLRLLLEDGLVDETYEIQTALVGIHYAENIIDGQEVLVETPYFDLGGTFLLDMEGRATLNLRTSADRDQAERAQKLTAYRPARADLRVDAEVYFDGPIEEIIDHITTLDASVEWNFADFQAEDIKIGSSNGEAMVAMSRRTNGEEEIYRGQYSFQASGQALSLPGAQLSRLELRDIGSFTIHLPINAPLESLATFRNELRFAVRGLRTPDVQISDLAGQLSLQKQANQPRRIQADLSTRIGNFRTDEIAISELRTTQSGSVRIGPNLEEPDLFRLIPSFRIQGDSTITKITAGEITIATAEATNSLSGELARPQGLFQAKLGEIDLGVEEIQTLHLEAQLDAPGEGTLKVDAHLLGARRYFFGTSLRFNAATLEATLWELLLGTDQVEWASGDQGQLRWDGNTLHFDELAIQHEDQEIGLEGTFTPGRAQNLSLLLDTVDLGAIRKNFYLEEYLPQLEAIIDTDLHLTGTATNPGLDVRSQLENLVVEGNGPFSIQLSASYTNEIARVRNLRVAGFGRDLLEMTATLPLLFDLEGTLEPQINRPFDLRLRLADINFTDFHDDLPILEDFGVTGQAQGALEASGQLSDPRVNFNSSLRGFSFRGELDGDFVDLQDVDFTSTLRYHSRARGGEGLHIDTDISWEGETVVTLLVETPLRIEQWLRAAVDERFDAPRLQEELVNLPLRFRLLVPELDLSRIPLESLQENRLAGILRADMDLSGTVLSPIGDIDLELTGFGWDQFRSIDLDVRARLEGQEAIFERIAMTWGRDDIFVADGVIPLPLTTLATGEAIDDIPLSFRFQLVEMPISRLSGIDYAFARIRGTMAAYFKLDGTVRNPRIEARAGLFNTRLGDGNPGTIHVEILGEDNQLTVQGAMCHRVEEFLTYSGQAPVLLDFVELAQGRDWMLPGEIEFALRGENIDLARNLPVQLISEFVVDPEGELSLDLRASGTWEEPTINGSFSISEGALTLPEFARRFTNIEGNLDVDDDRLLITNFSLTDGPGNASLRGEIAHENFQPGRVALTIETEDFNVGGFGLDFPVFVDSNIEVGGRMDTTPARVRVDLSSLTVVVTDDWDRSLHSTDLDEDIVILRRDDSQTPASEVVDTEEDPFHIVIDLSIARGARAFHPNGDIHFMADLTTEVRGSMVAMSGEVDLLRGELEFLGRRFSVQESQVSFVGSVPPNPRLQLEAHHMLDRAITQAIGPPATGEPRIIIRITGTADQPRLEFQSDPAMNDTEILFVLMTGRPPDRTGVGQEEGVAAQALAAVGGLFVGMLQEQLAGTVPVDVLRLDPALPGMEGGRLEVGKYLTNNLFLSYRRQFGADENVASNVIRLEYHFLPRWMGELRYTDRNEGAINIYWDPL